MATRRSSRAAQQPRVKQEPGLKAEATPSPQQFPQAWLDDVCDAASAAAGTCATFAAAAPAKSKKRGSKNDRPAASAKKSKIAAAVKVEKGAAAAATTVKGEQGAVPAWARFVEPPATKDEAEKEPYPNFKGPSPQECADAVAAMAEVYGLPSEKRPVPLKRPDLLDSLVGTILSQNTTDVNSRRAFKSLKETLPTWRDVLDTDPEVMIEAIKMGGEAALSFVQTRSDLHVA